MKTRKIRLWKLGDHKNGILPNKTVVNKLVKILSTKGDGDLDIVWDDLIDVVEFTQQIKD